MHCVPSTPARADSGKLCSALEAGYLYAEEIDGLSESELLAEIDQAIRAAGLPSRGDTVTPS